MGGTQDKLAVLPVRETRADRRGPHAAWGLSSADDELLSRRKGPGEMSEAERAFLNPWEKHQKHSRFPFKFTLHTLLVLLVTAQLLVFNLQDALYSRTMHKGFKFFFMPEGYDRDDAPQTMTVYTLEDTLSGLQKVVDEFWALPAKSIATMGWVESDE